MREIEIQAKSQTDVEASASTAAYLLLVQDSERSGPLISRAALSSERSNGVVERSEPRSKDANEEPTPDRPSVGFDVANRPVEIRYSNGIQVKLSHDDSGNLAQVEFSGGTRRSGNGFINGVLKLNGDHYDCYDAKGQLTDEKFSKVDIRSDGTVELKSSQDGLSWVKKIAKDGSISRTIDF